MHTLRLLPPSDVETAAGPRMKLADPKMKEWLALKTASAATRWAVKQPVATLERAVKDLKARYYNLPNAAQVSDAVYDAIEDALVAKAPQTKATQSGAPVLSRDKVKLSVFMGSQRKIKTADDIAAFIAKQGAPGYMISAKLDGVSALYENVGGTLRLATKGDGTTGKDISGLIPSIRNLPRIRPGVRVRGEMIVSEAEFNKKWVGDGTGNTFKNARGMVSGVTNRTDVHAGATSIQFIAFELIDGGKPTEQMKRLKSMGFEVVAFKPLRNPTFDTMVEALKGFQRCGFEIDGAILIADEEYTSARTTYPDYSVAFKPDRTSGFSLDQEVETTVKRVIWRETKHGEIRPRIEIEPVRLAGATINYATAFNASFIKEKGIGPGARITIVRSGSVIPYITGVVKRVKPQMPDIPYEIRDKQAYSIEQTDEVEIRLAEHFFDTLGIEGFRYNSVVKMFEAGFDQVEMIADATEDEFVEVLGVNGRKIFAQIESLYDDPAPLAQMLDASACFKGIGTKQFQKLTTVYPDLLKLAPKAMREAASGVDGWGATMADVLVRGMPEFRRFLKDTGLPTAKPKPKAKPKGSKLAGQNILLTNFRDDALGAAIESQGGKLASGYSSKVTLVLSPAGKESNKTRNAEADGVPVMDPAAFKRKYGV